MVAGDIFVGNFRVRLDDGIAAKLVAPLVGGVGEFILNPSGALGMERFAGRPHHDETVHKRVVDRALKPRALLKGAGGFAGGFPASACFDQVNRARTPPRKVSRLEMGVIDDNGSLFGMNFPIWHEGDGQGGNIRRSDLNCFPFPAKTALAGHDRGIDVGALPVLFQSVDGDPVI